jgi:hypothetical protein
VREERIDLGLREIASLHGVSTPNSPKSVYRFRSLVTPAVVPRQSRQVSNADHTCPGDSIPSARLDPGARAHVAIISAPVGRISGTAAGNFK